MKITARVDNAVDKHFVTVQTNDMLRGLDIPAKTAGAGSAVNGGEFLCLALATCFCNDIYREARKRNISITQVRVEASAEFAAEGEPAYNIIYRAEITGDASDEALAELIKHTDQVSEIQNTLRAGVKVALMQ